MEMVPPPTILNLIILGLALYIPTLFLIIKTSAKKGEFINQACVSKVVTATLMCQMM